MATPSTRLLIAWPAERVSRDLVSPPLGCAAVQLGVKGVKLLRVKEGEPGDEVTAKQWRNDSGKNLLRPRPPPADTRSPQRHRAAL